MRCSCVPPPTLQTLQTLQTLPPPPPPRPFASVCFDPLAWSSGSDQCRISGCGTRWLLAGPDSLPCRVCAFVLLRCFSCSHTVLPKEHSLGVIFFSSLSSCKCCIFLQFYLHFTTDYTCMIVYVTNNKEPFSFFPKRSGGCAPEAFVIAKQPSAVLSVTRRKLSHDLRCACGILKSLDVFISMYE